MIDKEVLSIEVPRSYLGPKRVEFLDGRADLMKQIEELRKAPQKKVTMKAEDLCEFMQCIVELGDIATGNEP